MSRLSLYSLVLFAGLGASLAACGSDDDEPTGSAGAGGKSSAGAGGKSSAGAAGKATAGATNGEGGEGGAAESTLYDRLGGHDGIKDAISAIVTEELKDDDIASFFAPNLVPGHEPQAGAIIDCFTNLLGKAAGGPEEYPFTTDDGFTCRGMAESHADLHIGGGTFDNFVTIAAGVLKDAGVADDDIAVVGSVLVDTKDAIVDPDAPLTGPCVSPACEVGAAGAGGAAN